MCFLCEELYEELTQRLESELAKENDQLTTSVAFYRAMLEYRRRLDAAQREHHIEGASASDVRRVPPAPSGSP